MRKEEIKETKEVVVDTRYVAEDGNVFYSQEECEKYEKSALFVAKSKLKLIATTNEDALTVSGCYDDEVEIFDVQTQEDLDNLKIYLHLMLSTHGNRDIDSYFNGSKFGFNDVTFGHEVIIWWDYEKDHFWVYGNGSIDDYIEHTRSLVLKVIEENKKEND